MRKIINKGIDIAAALLIIGIIAFFLVGGPRGGNPEVTTTAEATTVATTEAITESSTEAITETTTEATTVTTTEHVEETTTKVVETTTKKEVVTATATPNARAKSSSKYTDEEIYLFAQILYCEAGGESKAEMARVGQVVLNRMNTDYWEFAKCKTINQVLRQSGQYPDTVAKIDRGIKPSQAAMEVARGLLNGTVDSGLGNDVYWQTGFVPDWNARVILKTPCDNGYHYYSVLAS